MTTERGLRIAELTYASNGKANKNASSDPVYICQPPRRCAGTVLASAPALGLIEVEVSGSPSIFLHMSLYPETES